MHSTAQGVSGVGPPPCPSSEWGGTAKQQETQMAAEAWRPPPHTHTSSTSSPTTGTPRCMQHAGAPAALDAHAAPLDGTPHLHGRHLHGANQPREEEQSDGSVGLRSPCTVGERAPEPRWHLWERSHDCLALLRRAATLQMSSLGTWRSSLRLLRACWAGAPLKSIQCSTVQYNQCNQSLSRLLPPFHPPTHPTHLHQRP